LEEALKKAQEEKDQKPPPTDKTDEEKTADAEVKAEWEGKENKTDKELEDKANQAIAADKEKCEEQDQARLEQVEQLAEKDKMIAEEKAEKEKAELNGQVKSPADFEKSESQKYDEETKQYVTNMANTQEYKDKVANERAELFKNDEAAYNAEKKAAMDKFKTDETARLMATDTYKGKSASQRDKWLNEQLTFSMEVTFVNNWNSTHLAPVEWAPKYSIQAENNINEQYENQRIANKATVVSNNVHSLMMQQQNDINRQKNDIDRALREELARLDKIVADQRNVHTQSGLDYNTELEKLVNARDIAWAAYYSAEGKKQADDKVMAYKIESIRKDAEADYVKKNTNKNKTEAEARKDFEKYWDEEGKEKARTVAVSRRLQELTDYNAKTLTDFWSKSRRRNGRNGMKGGGALAGPTSL